VTAALSGTAWSGDLRPVQLGNVAEFNDQFRGGRLHSGQLAGERHYACLAAFYSPHPGVLLLPGEIDTSWLTVATGQLQWDPVEVYDGLGTGAGLSDALSARPALVERIRRLRSPVIAWGRTAGFDRLLAAVDPAGGPDPAVLQAVRRFESKAAAHGLFGQLSRRHRSIRVPEQTSAVSRRELVRALRARAGAGMTTVLKAEYGVGGHGTVVVPPGWVTACGARLLVRRLLADGSAFPAGGLLIEEYVDGSGPYRDLTFDGVVAADGTTRPVGVGVMHIEAAHYEGVTVGPGVVPAGYERVAAGFGAAVGAALAAEGYRGWFDVDFVADRSGRLAPTEINLRLTGPAIAFMIQARLDRVRGGRHVVRTLDCLPLGARIPDDALFEHVARLRSECDMLGATLITTVPTASFEPAPYLGVAIAAATREKLAAAEGLVRAANRGLGAMFERVAPSARRLRRPASRRTRPVRRRR
jgi:hypothetical protein